MAGASCVTEHPTNMEEDKLRGLLLGTNLTLLELNSGTPEPGEDTFKITVL